VVLEVLQLGLLGTIFWVGLMNVRSTGEVDVLQNDEKENLWVTRLKWGVGPPGGEFTLTGLDVLTIVAGRIERCYTFLDAK
jgi:hypothetical protein